MNRQLGKKPAVRDDRVPRFSALQERHRLPEPPPHSNWYAAVGEWGMLKNDEVGDCVIAAAGHAVHQMTAYVGNELKMTDDEAINAYRAITGYDPRNPLSDQGTYVLGDQGLVKHWVVDGIICGGQVNRLSAAVSVDPKNLRMVKQAIHIFGGVLVGFSLPTIVLDTDDYVWRATEGPIAGGHEVWINGYQTMEDNSILFDLVSWGRRFRCTDEFMHKWCDEAIALFDGAMLDKRGVNGANVGREYLLAAMSSFSRVA